MAFCLSSSLGPSGVTQDFPGRFCPTHSTRFDLQIPPCLRKCCAVNSSTSLKINDSSNFNSVSFGSITNSLSSISCRCCTDSLLAAKPSFGTGKQPAKRLSVAFINLCNNKAAATSVASTFFEPAVLAAFTLNGSFHRLFLL